MSYQSAITARSPFIYLKVDETSGTTANDSGSRAINGTTSGSGTTWSNTDNLSDGSTGKAAIRFDNSTASLGRIDLGTTGTDLDDNNAFTYCAWVKLEYANTVNRHFFYKSGSIQLNAIGGYLSFTIKLNGSDVTRTMTTNQLPGDFWRHLAFVWTGRYLRTYINGSQVQEWDEGSVTFASTNTNNLYIGGVGGDYGGMQIDEITYFRTAMSATEIDHIYQASFGHQYIDPTITNVSVAGLAPTITAEKNVTVSPPVATITVDGKAATITAEKYVTVSPPVAGTITVDGKSPTIDLTTNITVNASLANIDITGKNPTMVGQIPVAFGAVEINNTSATAVTGITSINFAFSNNISTTDGTFVIVGMRLVFSGSISAPTLSDTAGNTWTILGSIANGASNSYDIIGYCRVTHAITAGDNLTLGWTTSRNLNSRVVQAISITGATVPTQYASALNSTINITPPSSAALLWGWSSGLAGATTTWTPPTSWTERVDSIASISTISATTDTYSPGSTSTQTFNPVPSAGGGNRVVAVTAFGLFVPPDITVSPPVAGTITVTGQAAVAQVPTINTDTPTITVDDLDPTITTTKFVTVSPDTANIEVSGLSASVTGAPEINISNVPTITATGLAPTVSVGTGVTVSATTSNINIGTVLIYPDLTLRPNGNFINAWSGAGYTEIDEAAASDLDYVSATYPGSFATWTKELRVDLTNPATTAGNTGNITVSYRYKKDGSPPFLKVALYEGSTLLGDSGYISTNPGSFVNDSFTVAANLVSDASLLRLRFEATSQSVTSALSHTVFVSWAQVEIPGTYRLTPTLFGTTSSTSATVAASTATITIDGKAVGPTVTNIQTTVGTNIQVNGINPTLQINGAINFGAETAGTISVAGLAPTITGDKHPTINATTAEITVTGKAPIIRTGPDNLTFEFIEPTSIELTALDSEPLTTIDLGPAFNGQTKTAAMRLGNTSSVATTLTITAIGVNTDLVENVDFSLNKSDWTEELTIESVPINGLTDVIWIRLIVPEEAYVSPGSFVINVEQTNAE